MHDTDAVGKARALRQRPTKLEALIWRWLRGRRFRGFKFRRQYPIGPYVADFYCHALALVIELDGSVHDSDSARDHDRRRAEYLQSLRITVLRIRNEHIREDQTAVADWIDLTINETLARKPLTRR